MIVIIGFDLVVAVLMNESRFAGLGFAKTQIINSNQMFGKLQFSEVILLHRTKIRLNSHLIAYHGLL